MTPESPPSLSGDLTARLALFAEFLRASPHNLLSPQALRELELRHFPESIAFAERLPAQGPLLDIGSGGGLPGVVIGMVRPDLDVHLLEATGKKVAFLRGAVDALGLSVTVHHGRAEDLGVDELHRFFAIVTARAVARLERLAELSAPFLRRGGVLYAIKGERWRDELVEAEKTLTRMHLGVVSTPDDRAPDADGNEPRILVLGRID